MQIAILTFSVIALAISVILLWFELQSIKRTQRTTISMQLRQRFEEPGLQAAIAQVRKIGEQQPTTSFNSNHQANGYHENGVTGNGHQPASNGLSTANQVHALNTVDQFFGHVGELIRRGIADEEIFVSMGPAINEMWYVMRPIRNHPGNGAASIDDFDYLYTEWLNWDHQHRNQAVQYQLSAQQSLSASTY